MIRIGLIRHGHTAWNRAGRIQGRSDIPLDEDARADLARLCLPAPWAEACLWSSPLLRAVETARILADRTPRTTPELAEMNWGDWEGQRGEDLLAQPGSGYRHIEEWGWNFRPPGGEAVAEVRARLQSWLQGLDGDALVVSHIGIMRVLLAQAHGWDFEGPAPFRVKRARIYALRLSEAGLIPDGPPVRLPQREAEP